MPGSSVLSKKRKQFLPTNSSYAVVVLPDKQVNAHELKALINYTHVFHFFSDEKEAASMHAGRASQSVLIDMDNFQVDKS